MADAGEGLIDAQNRIQERMDEREEERARRAVRQKEQDPEKLRRMESLRLAHTELSRQLGVPVRVGDPLGRVTVGDSVVTPANTGSLTIAVGLGLEE